MIAVWFSCGAPSAVAAKLTIEKYGKDNVRVINTPVKEEDEDNRRFLKDVEAWLGVPIEIAIPVEYQDSSAHSVWKKRRYISGIHGASCTKYIKKQARYEWQAVHKPDFHVLGFTLEEVNRHKQFVKLENPYLLPILIDARITKQDAFRIIKEAGIELPRMYRLGYNNANCIGCCKATSPTYWNHVRKTHPKEFNEIALLSRELGAKLVRHKGKRIYLDELPETAQGRPMKAVKFSCSIFCEEFTYLKEAMTEAERGG